MLQENIISIKKDNLPKGKSFVLRSSTLHEAMRSKHIVIDTYLRHINSHVFFEGFFWPPGHTIHHERIYVRTGAVPTAQARKARQFTDEFIIPQFIIWVQEILSLPRNAPLRQSEQRFIPDITAYEK
ncbi:hypothetical protein LJC47_07580 [Desulfosarcina sp. OttesenSCG-928-B08]|nr:hypothetical protein [Desulfosarcina sp. OttesenSCG-928-B08]